MAATNEETPGALEILAHESIRLNYISKYQFER